jgi:hypothetical protein
MQPVFKYNGNVIFTAFCGGALTMMYSKSGVLPAQRQVDVHWQDYTVVADVALVQLDAQITGVDSIPERIGA